MSVSRIGDWLGLDLVPRGLDRNQSNGSCYKAAGIDLI